MPNNKKRVRKRNNWVIYKDWVITEKLSASTKAYIILLLTSLGLDEHMDPVGDPEQPLYLGINDSLDIVCNQHGVYDDDMVVTVSEVIQACKRKIKRNCHEINNI